MVDGKYVDSFCIGNRLLQHDIDALVPERQACYLDEMQFKYCEDAAVQELADKVKVKTPEKVYKAIHKTVAELEMRRKQK